MSTVSEKIAEWVQATNYNNIPEEVLDIAKRCILDFVGVTLAGSREQTARIVRQYVNEVNGKGEATVIGLGIKAPCTEAALANGTVGHCLDYEDFIQPVSSAGGPHVTAVVLPAALAVAEKTNRTGKELIEAYVLGCEVVYSIGRAVEPGHFLSGWHNTGTHGIFGAAVAASKLLKLNADEITYALGIAGSEASGLRENFGTMTKPFHAGEASAKGVRAAMLARLGFTSAKTIFEGRNGFFNALCKKLEIDELTQNLGKPFGLPQVKLKLYPCCGAALRGIDGTLDLANEYNIKAEEVEEVIVKCHPGAADALTYSKPITALEGKFSIQFPVALALSERGVTLEQFTDDRVREPKIINLMQRVKLVPTSELAATNSQVARAVVEITLKGGKKLAKTVDFPRGTPENPLSDKQLLQKYRSCARSVLSEKATKELQELLLNLEKVEDIGKLANILIG